MEGDPPRYRFGPLERRGLIAGWRGGQIAVVVAGLGVAVVSVRHRPDAVGAVVALAALGSSLAVACWPLGGRTAEEWLPTLVRWGGDGLAGRRRTSEVPGAGRCAGRGPTRCPPAGPGRAGARAGGGPGAFAGLALLATEQAGQRAGVVYDGRAGTYTAVLSLAGHSFALLGTDEKERRVAAWSGVLAALAREHSSVRRLQWVAVAVPDDGRAVYAHLDDHAVLGPETAPQRSYRSLLAEAGAGTSRHEVLLAVQVGPSRGQHRAEAAVAVLLREVGNVRRMLEGADVHCGGPLDAPALALALRAALRRDPPGPAPGPDRHCPPCPLAAPWPMATEVEWNRLHTDETWHATYWVAEWPRVDVGPDFLGPLLLGPIRRSVSLVMEPVSPAKAVRAAEQARTADLADSELRRRGGFLSTARRSREAEQVVRRERELADGHASYRFSGYVTVTAADPERLEEWCAATEQAAGQARLELRRLYGDQERALLCTLPLCRGLS